MSTRLGSLPLRSLAQLLPFPGICAMIVFTAGSLKVSLRSAISLFDLQILSAEGRDQSTVICLWSWAEPGVLHGVRGWGWALSPSCRYAVTLLLVAQSRSCRRATCLSASPSSRRWSPNGLQTTRKTTVPMSRWSRVWVPGGPERGWEVGGRIGVERAVCHFSVMFLRRCFTHGYLSDCRERHICRTPAHSTQPTDMPASASTRLQNALLTEAAQREGALRGSFSEVLRLNSRSWNPAPLCISREQIIFPSIYLQRVTPQFKLIPSQNCTGQAAAATTSNPPLLSSATL